MEAIPLKVWVALGGIVALAAAFYLLVPLLIYNAQKFEAQPRMVRFDVEDYDWPGPIRELFTSARAALEADGFELREGLFLPSAAQNVKTALLLFANRETRDSAMATAMYAATQQPAMPEQGQPLQTLYVEFTCRFRDGRTVNTNNSHELSGLPPRPGVTSYWLPTVSDARDLFRIHQAASAEQGSRSQKVLRLDEEFNGDAVRYIQEVIRESFADAAEAGWLYETPDGRQFRPTLRGAYLMTWRLVWPWKGLRTQQRDRRERQALARFGHGDESAG